MNPYIRFALMLLTSGLLMYGLMYLHTYETGHVFFSQTRAWMTVIMVAGMAVVMLAPSSPASAPASTIRGCANSRTKSSLPRSARSPR